MKAVLVTGGSRGIGRATALACAARGWAVAVNYVGNQTAADQTVAAASNTGAQAVVVQGDVAIERDVLAMFDAAQSELGSLTGVVVNAGVVAPPSPLAEMTAERIRRVFEINVLGAYLCAREAARRLPQSRGGKGGRSYSSPRWRRAWARPASMSTTPARKAPSTRSPSALPRNSRQTACA